MEMSRGSACLVPCRSYWPSPIPVKQITMSMTKRISVAILTMAIGTSGLTSCSSVSPLFHEYMMSGNVVDLKDDGVAVVCIGTPDGARAGQTLLVFRTQGYEDAAGDVVTYGREEIGKIRILSVIDEHYARAEVLNGDIEKYDHVQLVDP